MELSARTQRLERHVSLVALAGEHGVLWETPRTSFAGCGEAVRIEVPRDDPAESARVVAEALDAINHHSELDLPGTGAVALGAWPFAPTAAGTLVVPEVLVGRAPDGTSWITTVTDGGNHDLLVDEVLEAADAAADTLAGFSTFEPNGPSGYEVRSSRSPGEWCEALAAARDELRSGVADKVVLAREVVVHADAPLPVASILVQLARRFPTGLRFSIDGFVGASPELLVSRAGDDVRCHPMAGTAPRSGDPEVDARLVADLAASAKNMTEHRHTIDLVHETLLPYCSYLDEEAEPSVVHLANVSHLATAVQGKLSSPPASVVELVGVLHPTPAVCGRPRDAALELIDRYEALDRDRYAGPVGWVDRHGNGSFAVGIRCAIIDGATARLFAGVGVVAESDPAAELAETRAKLEAVLDAVVRP